MQAKNIDAPGLHREIVQTSNELTVLHRSLDECVKSWKAFGFEPVPNPVAESIRRDIEGRKVLLKSSQQALVKFQQDHSMPTD